MAEKISFELVAPEQLLVSADFDMVVVPGSEGDFGVLVGHQPLVSSLRPGVVEMHDEGADIERYFVAGGFAEVHPESCTVLAEEAIAVAEMDRADLEQRTKNAEEDLEDAEGDEAKHKANQKLSLLREMLKAVS
jgi:F-type H+-transporting ATPase subunit epsilon